jgi:hypothetical protein
MRDHSIEMDLDYEALLVDVTAIRAQVVKLVTDITALKATVANVATLTA